MAQDSTVAVENTIDSERKSLLLTLRRMEMSIERRLDRLEVDDEVATVLQRILPPIKRAIDHLKGNSSHEARLKYMREYMKKRRKQRAIEKKRPPASCKRVNKT